jgi:isopenicillin N synthase-like dioxygenase
MVLINIGDMMKFWTAGKAENLPVIASGEKSNCRGPGGVTDRFCFTYFLHPTEAVC